MTTVPTSPPDPEDEFACCDLLEECVHSRDIERRIAEIRAHRDPGSAAFDAILALLKSRLPNQPRLLDAILAAAGDAGVGAPPGATVDDLVAGLPPQVAVVARRALNLGDPGPVPEAYLDAADEVITVPTEAAGVAVKVCPAPGGARYAIVTPTSVHAVSLTVAQVDLLCAASVACAVGR